MVLWRMHMILKSCEHASDAEQTWNERCRSAGDLSRENCIQAFRQHTKDVQKRVPEKQLLLWKPQDGWEPLAK